jgi:hypothetical protein
LRTRAPPQAIAERCMQHARLLGDVQPASSSGVIGYGKPQATVGGQLVGRALAEEMPRSFM